MIHEWGVEFAGRHYFYSMNGNKHGVFDHSFRVQTLSDTEWVTIAQFNADGVGFAIELVEKLIDNKIIRTVTLQSDDDIEITGLALRFQFRSDTYPQAFIHNKSLMHENSSRFNMFETNFVQLRGFSSVETNYEVVEAPSGFNQFSYARDLSDRWIVHHRLLPNPDNPSTRRLVRVSDKLNFKIFRYDFQTFVTWLVRSNFFWKILWHQSERSSKIKIPINAYGLYSLKKGIKIKMQSTTVFVN